MAIERHKVEAVLRKFKEEDNKKLIKSIKMSDFETVKENLEKSISNTRSLMDSESIINNSTFALWNDIWNDYGIYGLKRDEESRSNSSSKTFSRGRLLFIDFGQHNIGLEFSFDHIGIVLNQFEGMHVVAPVTSDRKQTYKPKTESAVIRVDNKIYTQFENESIILLHQITAISNNRIIRDLGKSISGTTLLEDIDKKIQNLYSPKARDQSKIKDNLIKSKDLEIDNLKKQIHDMIEAQLEAAPESDEKN